MFTSGPAHYSRNTSQAASYRAFPALLTAKSGEQEPGVILRTGAEIRGVLPVSEALRLADQIHDAAESHYRTTDRNNP